MTCIRRIRSILKHQRTKHLIRKGNKFNDLQKKICDEFVLYHSLRELYMAHLYFFLLAMKNGWIRNPLRGLFAKKNSDNTVEK